MTTLQGARSASFAARAARLARRLACGAALAAGAAHAQTAITLNPTAAIDMPWGSRLALQAVVTGACTTAPNGSVVNLLDFDTRLVSSATITGASCTGGAVSNATVTFDNVATHTLEIGTHVLRARVGGLASNLLTVRVAPNFTLPWSAGAFLSGISTSPLFSRCDLRQSGQHERELSPVPVPPPNLRTPYEVTSLISGACVFGPTNPGYGPGGSHYLWSTVQMPVQIPPEAELWVYDNFFGTPRWRKVERPCTAQVCVPVVFPPAIIRGNNATFELFGNPTSVVAAAAFAFPQPSARTLPLQDMWWSGPEQNGWGLTIAKNGERLFVTLFVYDGDGRPMWAVMPEGQWDPVHEVWSGNLYIPTGTTWQNYEYARFVRGNAVGTASLSFPTPDEGHLDYTINNFSGGKQIFRYVFGPRGQEAPFAGIWWGGANQDGWGVSVQQQGDNAFVTWYTYETDGRTLWFFMPAGKRTTGNRFSGTLYRTTAANWAGSFWRGVTTNVTAVGTMEIDFSTPDTATMTTVVNGVRLVQPLLRFGF